MHSNSSKSHLVPTKIYIWFCRLLRTFFVKPPLTDLANVRELWTFTDSNNVHTWVMRSYKSACRKCWAWMHDMRHIWNVKPHYIYTNKRKNWNNNYNNIHKEQVRKVTWMNLSAVNSKHSANARSLHLVCADSFFIHYFSFAVCQWIHVCGLASIVL